MLQSFFTKIVKLRIFGKSPANAYLRLNQRLWEHLPFYFINRSPIRAYGNFLQKLVRLQAVRTQNFGTMFLRNRPQLELIRNLCTQKSNGTPLRIAVMACSKGAEVYSLMWTIRSARPDLKVMMHAVDMSKEVLEFARKGIYSLITPEFTGAPLFERMTREEMEQMFEKDGDHVEIKSWIKGGITWHLGDARDPEILNDLGPQDMVVASNFLCHMEPPDAERCLRNIARLVNPGGYLFVSGIDLDVRTKVAHDLGWNPLVDLIKEIHEGDPVMRVDWPWKYWGLEPFNKRRQDWNVRYASGFVVNK